MSNEYGFFASKNHDRRYSADDFSSFFGDFFTDGVLGKNSSSLMVEAAEDMTIKINAGTAYIKGRWYRTSSEKTLEISGSDTAYDRIDAVVIRCDFEKRMVYPAVIEGIASETPSEPQITRDERYYDIVLACIYVTANCVKITQADITDKRGFDDVCGFVTSAIDHIDTEELFSQYEAQWELLKAGCKNDADKVISAWDSLVAVKTINNAPPVEGNINLTQSSIPSDEKAYQNPYFIQAGSITITTAIEKTGLTISFPTAFTKAPIVQVTLSNCSVSNYKEYMPYAAIPEITTSGFTVKVAQPQGTGSSFSWSNAQFRGTIYWTAFGEKSTLKYDEISTIG